MATRLLLRNCTNVIKNGNQQWTAKSLSTGSVRFGDDPNKALSVREPAVKDPSIELNPTEYEKQRALQGYITIEGPENVAVLSGVPEEHIKNRTVRIYEPAKNAMQSGTNNINFWQMDFDTRERWENPLMGWTSSGDPHSNLKVEFATKEEAIAHCEKMGWRYYIQKPNAKTPKPRSYGVNFSWDKRTRVSTK
ncbi:NADH dehydrogenase [ubiquinone] iron-sulfur protein 4, mitochondrial [Neodiprion virginianus]|uniref:NADH dehydrogenase [ubiquinone] iron-sulfur protein 4, mitochondrial n=1 Tax=Neodiprion virginianus TaxID=2961670 RepID=UPI001EE71110|nr:NADH dehydrogenase [ubiquinone] iron-sulfur protein 4, mitochondrial [Neodiprion virginianus]